MSIMQKKPAIAYFSLLYKICISNEMLEETSHSNFCSNFILE